MDNKMRLLPLLGLLLGLLIPAPARADNACYKTCYERAKPCEGRQECNARSGGCYDDCDRRKTAPPPPPSTSSRPPLVAARPLIITIMLTSIQRDVRISNMGGREDERAADEICRSSYGATRVRVGGAHIVRGVVGAKMVAVRDGVVRVSIGYMPAQTFAYGRRPDRAPAMVHRIVAPYLLAAAALRQRASELPLGRIDGRALDPGAIPAPRPVR